MSQSVDQQPLWTLDELAHATGGAFEGGDEDAWPLMGISIDTRTLTKGDLFVALQDVRDGHDFVTQAFGKGAAVALVKSDYEKHADDGLLLRVDDPLQALEKMAVAARQRLTCRARVMAVTGSAGKTTTKEMLRVCFMSFGKTHASEKSYNNHWGVPLTLARMPRDTDFAVIEIGMNHPGEIRPLTKMASPHVALVTSVLPVHLEHFSGLEEIAQAKAEIFEGLQPDGIAVIPAFGEMADFLGVLAHETLGLPYNSEHVFQSGHERIACFTLEDNDPERWCLGVEKIELSAKGSIATLIYGQDELDLELVLPGTHNVMNAAACITAVSCALVGLDIPLEKGDAYLVEQALRALKTFQLVTQGRGQVLELGDDRAGKLTLIDESYNANPASMSAAFENLSLYPGNRRKLAVLGDMLELGETADELHGALAIEIERTGIDKVFACGPHMKALFTALNDEKRGAYAANADELKGELFAALKNDDIIMVKGSNGSRMATLVEALKVDLPPLRDGGNN
ncbi:MAG: UDP-N-acetylmuramoyl-tripeptide--D-alanyl-D-alanine ligase [Hyphomicrobiaceae bacterium]|nr:UDP-N-acetylmuramoyl-tripeptide--D-alanyl-D-alanine ligase [Hyphomicrobiaceae bacterium]